MMRLKQLLNKPLLPIPNKLAIIILIVALLGFVDASYLAIKHFQGVIPPCSLVSGCETVLNSSYSEILGIPVSLLGALYYLVILVGVFAYLESKNTKLLKWSLLLTFFGFIFSLWFIYIQAFILKSYCIYCIGSFVTSTTLFVIALIIFSKYQNETIQYTHN